MSIIPASRTCLWLTGSNVRKANCNILAQDQREIKNRIRRHGKKYTMNTSSNMDLVK